MRKEERLKCTIGGKPVAEVDVSGMFLTLLCSITGDVPFTTRFEDPYQLPHHFKDIDRSEVKAVINSAIGGGSWKQYQPTKMIKRPRHQSGTTDRDTLSHHPSLQVPPVPA